MVHIMRQRQNRKRNHTKRTERIIEDSELTVVQCDHFVWKDVAATDGLKVLSMYVKTLGYGMSTVVEMKGATDTFALLVAENVEIAFDSLTSFCSVTRNHPSLI